MVGWLVGQLELVRQSIVGMVGWFVGQLVVWLVIW